jgi:hypothetical protein
MRPSWLACLAVGVCFLGTVVHAADEEVEVTEEEQTQAPINSDAYDGDEPVDDVSADVTTTYLFPSLVDKKFPVGKPVTILINFINNGQEVLNITRVAAFLHSPFDLNYYIQNFSGSEVSGGMVGPKSQMSLNYQFIPDTNLEPLEFWMSGLVDYQADGSDKVYQSTFLNETVTLVNHGSAGELTIILSTLVLLGAFAVGIYTLMNSTKKGAKAKKKFTAKPEVTEADKAAAAASWEPVTSEKNKVRKMRK